MELKQRKRIKNMPGFYAGTDLPSKALQQEKIVQTVPHINMPVNYGTADETITGRTLPDIVVTGTYRPNTERFGADYDIGEQKPQSVSTQIDDSKAGKAMNAMAISSMLLAGMGDTVNAYNMMFNQPKPEEIVSSAGTTNTSRFGVGYTSYNNINSKEYLKQQAEKGALNTGLAVINGVAAGMLTGGVWGAVAGGITGLAMGGISSIIGRNKLRRNLIKANMLRRGLNLYGESGAMSLGLSNKYYSKYGLNNGRVYANV